MAAIALKFVCRINGQVSRMIFGMVEDLKKLKIQCIETENHSFALIYKDDQFYLLDNLCPHKAAALCEGGLYGDEIECPWHGARFNIKTGHGLTALAGKGVKLWPLSEQNGQLSVKLD